jgi:hypothetical protein
LVAVAIIAACKPSEHIAAPAKLPRQRAAEVAALSFSTTPAEGTPKLVTPPRIQFDGVTSELVYWGAHEQPVTLTFRVAIDAEGMVTSVTPAGVEPPDHPLATGVTPEIVRALRAAHFEAPQRLGSSFSFSVRFDTRHPQDAAGSS